MILRKAYKFRLKTNQTMARKLAQFAGSSRLVWNKALAFQKQKLNAKESCLSYAGLTKELTAWKKEKFSNRWRILKAKITKLHIRITNTRGDYLHKISSEISKNHAIVILEDLKIANMSRSVRGTVENRGKNVTQKSGLNRAILDQGWGEFVRQLKYKLTWNGGQLIQINPRNTSRKCPECGYISAENRKTQSTFCCQNCNYTANADFVGSLNIKEAGLALLGLGGSSLELPVKSQPADGV